MGPTLGLHTHDPRVHYCQPCMQLSFLLLKLFFKIPPDESKNPFCLADDVADMGIPLKIADHPKMLCL